MRNSNQQNNSRLASRLTTNQRVDDSTYPQSNPKATSRIRQPEYTPDTSNKSRPRSNERPSAKIQKDEPFVFNGLGNTRKTPSQKEPSKVDAVKDGLQKNVLGRFKREKPNLEDELDDDIISSTERDLELEELKKARDERKKEVRGKLSTRIINIFLIVACVYTVFLIYGVSVTDYQYNKDGNIEAQKLSVSDIRAKKNYEEIKAQYERCRILYENTLMLDYRLGQGEEDPLTIGPEYEKLLDDVTDLSVKTDAMTVDTRYSQVKNLLLAWIKNDIAVYLQNMSAAISQNNSEKANNALQDKDRVYTDFSTITSNMVSLGEKLEGVDITSIKEWTPENYINDKIKGDK